MSYENQLRMWDTGKMGLRSIYLISVLNLVSNCVIRFLYCVDDVSR